MGTEIASELLARAYRLYRAEGGRGEIAPRYCVVTNPDGDRRWPTLVSLADNVDVVAAYRVAGDRLVKATEAETLEAASVTLMMASNHPVLGPADDWSSVDIGGD